MSELAAAKPVAVSSRIRSIDLKKPAAWIAAGLAGAWAGYFLFTGMPQLTLHVFPRTIVMHSMFGGLAIGYVIYLLAGRRLPGGSPLDAPVCGFVAAYALATYTSLNWRTSLEPALFLGAAVIVFYALSDLPLLTAEGLRRAFMVTTGILAVYALWIVGNDYADYLRFANAVEGIRASNVFPPTVPRVHDVSDHPNVLAMLMVLALPFFALSAYRGAVWDRALGVAALFVGAMALFLTLSRGGWIGAGCGVAFTLGATWFTLRTRDRELRGEPSSWRSYVPGNLTPTALAAVAGAAVLTVGGTLAFLSNSSSRPGWLFRSSLSPRQDAWRAGWHMFTEHLLSGAGPDMFGILYPQYAHGNFLVHTQHTHNGFLQVAVDAGLLGVVALVGLAVGVTYTLARTWQRGSPEQRLLAVACAGSLIGFSIHNQLDAGNIWKAPAIALAMLGAIIVRNWRESGGGSRDSRQTTTSRETKLDTTARYASRGARLAVLLLIPLPLLGWYRLDAAHYDYWRGAEALNEAKPGAIEHLQSAVDADSSMVPYRLMLGEAEAASFDTTGRANTALITGAVVNLQRAVALDAGSDLAHANLAKAYQLAGRDDAAALEAQKTRFIAQYHVPPVLLAAEVYEEIGRSDDAIATYGQVLSMDAGIADSRFWQTSDFRRQHFDEILRRSAIGINPCTEGSFLVRAHQSDSQTSLAGLDRASKGCQLTLLAFPDDLVLRTNFAKILMQQGRTDEAFGHLAFAVKRQPDFGPARTELGRWYQLKGDIESARREWVVGGQLDEAESLLLLGDSYPYGAVPAQLADRLEALLKTGGTSVGNDLVSILYFRMRYGRISPVSALVPGDWQQAIPRLYQEMQEALKRWRGDSTGG